jgi:hypothetical protein
MRRELKKQELKQQGKLTAGKAGSSEHKLEIRKEFADIATPLEHIAHDLPPKLDRDRWHRFSQEFRQKLTETRKCGRIRWAWQTLRDSLRASDSLAWRLGYLVIIFTIIALLGFGLYALYELFRSQTSPEGLAAAGVVLSAARSGASRIFMRFIRGW